MKTLRQIGSLAFVVGLFTSVFAGLPWYVVAVDDPRTPWWLRLAVFCLLGGILLVLVTLAIEQKKAKATVQAQGRPNGGKRRAGASRRHSQRATCRTWRRAGGRPKPRPAQSIQPSSQASWTEAMSPPLAAACASWRRERARSEEPDTPKERRRST